MSRSKVLVVTVSIVIWALAAMVAAQDGPIGQNFLIKPTTGQEMQWEAAYKEHLKFHADANDPWTWVAYQIMSGPDTGKYIIRTGGHEWKDFDAHADFEMKDYANYFETAAKYTESYSINFDRIHRNLSRVMSDGGSAKIIEITNVTVKMDKVGDFIAAVGKYQAAFEKTNSPARYVTASVETGGRVGEFLFVGLHQNYASLDQDPANMAMMMEEVYGRQEAAAILADFNECVEEMHSSIAIVREDLTYRAPTSSSSQ